MAGNVLSSAPPRVALVTGGLKLGGSTTFLCNLAGELVRRGIQAHVLSFETDNPLAADFHRLNVPTLCLDDRRFIFEDRMRIVLEALGRFRPSVVVATLGPTSFEVLRYVPENVFRAGMVQADDPPVYEMVKRYARCLDLVGAVSRTIQRRLKNFVELSRTAIEYLPYGVPMPEHQAVRASRPTGPLRILYLGRLYEEQKRVRRFPIIFDQLRTSGIAFHWTIAGEGPEKAFLQSTMRVTSPEQTVSFPGKISYQDVPRILSEHDIFVLASDYEGLPLSLLEAMGQGLVPVVSNSPSGIPEVVDETTGKLIAPDNVAGFAQAITWLQQHPDQMARLSQNARERVRRDFSVSAMTDRWLRVFPAQVRQDVMWREHWRIRPPLVARYPIYFSRAARIVRRLAARMRSVFERD